MDSILKSTGIKVEHVLTKDNEIDSIPIKNGRLYLCEDSGAIYYDHNNERKKIMNDTLKSIDTKMSNINSSLFSIRESIDNIQFDFDGQYIDATNEDIDALFDN